ncbi:MAG: ExbD/TolR family protein [Bacilli bacterium]
MTELNVTPLMDLAFSLLIIFMISTPLLEQTIPINLPKQEENPSNARPEIEFQVISINAKGQIYWGKQPVDMVELNSLWNLYRNARSPGNKFPRRFQPAVPEDSRRYRRH